MHISLVNIERWHWIVICVFPWMFWHLTCKTCIPLIPQDLFQNRWSRRDPSTLCIICELRENVSSICGWRLCWPQAAVYSSMLTLDCYVQLYVDLRLLCTALCWLQAAVYSSMLTWDCYVQIYVDFRLLYADLCWPQAAMYSSMLTSDCYVQLYVDLRLLCTALCWPETAMYSSM